MKGFLCFPSRRLEKEMSNPYADRGLDKFSLVSAELEAKREKLAAELGTPLSMVKFAIGSHNRWIPIVLSKSTRKASQAPKKKRSTREKDTPPSGIKGYKSPWRSLMAKDKAMPRDFANVDKRHSDGLVCHGETPLCDPYSENGSHIIKGNTPPNGPMEETHLVKGCTPLNDSVDETPLAILSIKNVACPGGLMNAESAISSGPMRENVTHVGEVNSKDGYKAHTDVLTRQCQKSLSILMSDGSASSCEITEPASATFEVEAMVSYQVPMIASKASTIASPTWSERAPSALAGKSSRKHLGTAVRRPWVKETTLGIGTEEAGTPQGAAVKLSTKCKVNECLNVWSAPSTPSNSRQPMEFRKAPSFPDLAAHTDVRKDKLVEKTILDTAQRTRLSVLAAVSAENLRSRQRGNTLVVAGLMLSLIGLVMGYSSALVGVVCWWYMLPILRKAVGDNPNVRKDSDIMVMAESKGIDSKAKRNKVMIEAARARYDLQFRDYPKKVIMEGLLDRSRASDGLTGVGPPMACIHDFGMCTCERRPDVDGSAPGTTFLV